MLFETRVIELQNKQAEEMIPLIEPLLPQGSVVTGHGSQMIVRTTFSGFADLHSLLQSLDRPPQVLVITARRVHNAAYDTQVAARGAVDVVDTQPNNRQDEVQRITVQDGQAAFIKTGEAIPVHSWQYSDYGSTNTVQYQEVTSGFYVTPKLHGQHVTLYINWQHNELQAQQTVRIRNQSPIDVEQSESTLTISLGQWINLSNTSRQSLTKANEDSYSTQDVQDPDKNVFVKIDLLPVNKPYQENQSIDNNESYNTPVRPN